MAGVWCKYTTEEHVFLLTHYYQQNADNGTIFNVFQQQFFNSPTQIRQNVHKMHTTFQQHSTVADALRLGWPRIVCDHALLVHYVQISAKEVVWRSRKWMISILPIFCNSVSHFVRSLSCLESSINFYWHSKLEKWTWSTPPPHSPLSEVQGVRIIVISFQNIAKKLENFIYHQNFFRKIKICSIKFSLGKRKVFRKFFQLLVKNSFKGYFFIEIVNNSGVYRSSNL